MGNGTSDAKMVQFVYGEAVGYQDKWAADAVTAAIRAGKFKPCTPDLKPDAGW